MYKLVYYTTNMRYCQAVASLDKNRQPPIIATARQLQITPVVILNTVFALSRTGLEEPVLGDLFRKSSQRRLFTAARIRRNTASDQVIVQGRTGLEEPVLGGLLQGVFPAPPVYGGADSAKHGL
jgi:hypothetical protein